METFDTIRNLTTFERCRDETIPRKVIGKILESGRNAPSPGNVQSIEFIVVEDNQKKELLNKHTGDHRTEEAATAIIVLTDDRRMRRRVGDFADRACESEAASAIQNMRLIAEEEGLSSVFVGGFNSHAVGESFGVPDDKTVRGVVLLGYTDDPKPPRHKFGLNEIAYYDEYDNQVQSIFDGLEWKGVREERRIYEKKGKGLVDKLRRKLRKTL